MKTYFTLLRKLSIKVSILDRYKIILILVIKLARANKIKKTIKLTHNIVIYNDLSDGLWTRSDYLDVGV